MQTRKLETNEWGSYFDRASKELTTRTVSIEVASLAIGDQIEVETVQLRGLTYDHKDDIFEVSTSAVDHMIDHPAEIYVQDSAAGLESVEVVQTNDTRQIIKLSEPLRLPSHASS